MARGTKSTKNGVVLHALMAVAGVAMVLAVGVSGERFRCKWASEEFGTTFDLTPLRLPTNTSYQVYDSRADPFQSYTYEFNICDLAARPNAQPKEPGDPNPCSVNQAFPNSPAYQYGTSGFDLGACYQLADPNSPPQYRFYESTDPSRGVVVTMGNGASTWCRGGTKRFLAVALDCTPGMRDNAPDIEPIKQTNACQYEIYLKSHWGCPLECMSGPERHICSNQGVCGFNTDEQKSQCFCNIGFEGPFCETRSKSSGGGMSPEGAILIVVGFLLFAVIGFTAFMFVKLRKLQVDPNAYGELQGRFNELGQIA